MFQMNCLGLQSISVLSFYQTERWLHCLYMTSYRDLPLARKGVQLHLESFPCPLRPQEGHTTRLRLNPVQPDISTATGLQRFLLLFLFPCE